MKINKFDVFVALALCAGLQSCAPTGRVVYSEGALTPSLKPGDTLGIYVAEAKIAPPDSESFTKNSFVYDKAHMEEHRSVMEPAFQSTLHAGLADYTLRKAADSCKTDGLVSIASVQANGMPDTLVIGRPNGCTADMSRYQLWVTDVLATQELYLLTQTVQAGTVIVQVAAGTQWNTNGFVRYGLWDRQTKNYLMAGEAWLQEERIGANRSEMIGDFVAKELLRGLPIDTRVDEMLAAEENARRKHFRFYVQGGAEVFGDKSLAEKYIDTTIYKKPSVLGWSAEMIAAYFPTRWGVGVVYTPLNGYSADWQEEGYSDREGGILQSGFGVGVIGYRELYRSDISSANIIQVSLRTSYLDWKSGSGAPLSKNWNGVAVRPSLAWNIEKGHFTMGFEAGLQYQWLWSKDDNGTISFATFPLAMNMGLIF